MHGVADNVVRRKISVRDPESQRPCESPPIRRRPLRLGLPHHVPPRKEKGLYVEYDIYPTSTRTTLNPVAGLILAGPNVIHEKLVVANPNCGHAWRPGSAGGVADIDSYIELTNDAIRLRGTGTNGRRRYRRLACLPHMSMSAPSAPHESVTAVHNAYQVR
jgi:hypothetical protein